MGAGSNLTFRLGDALRRELEALARANERSLSGEIRYALVERLAAARGEQGSEPKR